MRLGEAMLRAGDNSHGIETRENESTTQELGRGLTGGSTMTARDSR